MRARIGNDGDVLVFTPAEFTRLTALTGSTSKGKDRAQAAKELQQALGQRPDAATAENALRDLLSAKRDVEYGVALVTAAKAEPSSGVPAPSLTSRSRSSGLGADVPDGSRRAVSVGVQLDVSPRA